jgi:uncharacterized protein YggE
LDFLASQAEDDRGHGADASKELMMFKVSPAFATAALLLAASPLTAHAQTASGAAPGGAERMFDATTLDLSAYGETKVAPDEATITLGVQTKAATATGAMQQNAAQMNRIMGALRNAGIPEKDIQTSGLSLDAQYTYQQNQAPLLNGYQASNEVVITVEDLAKLGSVLDSAVAAGANQINGVSFGLKDSQAANDAARLAAVKGLRAKADLYAQATGYRVARLVSLSEGGGYAPQPIRPVMALAKAAAPMATPVAPGELTVRIDVTGLYELAR